MKNIAVFASGNGTNAERIAVYFAQNPNISVRIILTNNPNAFVIERAKKLNLPVYVFNRDTFYQTEEVLQPLRNYQTDLIVLAGFMWLVPGYLIHAYPGRIINIHPALLPKYGGKGMYGHHVHEAVLKNREKVSGITIHFVNEKYDDGQIIFQKELSVMKNDTPDTLASRIHKLEYKYYPKVIERLLKDS